MERVLNTTYSSHIGYRDADILITGGLGFIGSNIARGLVESGAHVTILDALLPNNGGSARNMAGIEDKVEVILDDIRNRDVVNRLVSGKDIIFNLAGQVSYTDSMRDPFMDIDVSCRGHITVLEACRQYNQHARVVFASSRMVYARNLPIPVNESASTDPLTIYGIHKLTGEKYHKLYHEMYDISTVSVRITNPYGPRQRIEGGKYGIVNWFLRLASQNESIRIFGSGKQIRDYIYIDDLVGVFLKLGLAPGVGGRVFNAGTGKGTSLKEMAEQVVRVVKRGYIEHVEWPESYSRFESGDFVADLNRLKEALGEINLTSLDKGLEKTMMYYKNQENG